MHKQVSERQVAASPSNAQRSTGPKTPEGKARASLNSIKHGAFAKTDNVRREIMARRGEDPAEYDTNSCSRTWWTPVSPRMPWRPWW